MDFTIVVMILRMIFPTVFVPFKGQSKSCIFFKQPGSLRINTFLVACRSFLPFVREIRGENTIYDNW